MFTKSAFGCPWNASSYGGGDDGGGTIFQPTDGNSLYRRARPPAAAAQRRLGVAHCLEFAESFQNIIYSFFFKSDPARNLAVFLSLNVTALAKNFATSFVKKSSSKFCSYYESCLPLFLKLELDAQNLLLINGCFPTISSQFFANYMCTFHRTDVKQSF